MLAMFVPETCAMGNVDEELDVVGSEDETKGGTSLFSACDDVEVLIDVIGVVIGGGLLPEGS